MATNAVSGDCSISMCVYKITHIDSGKSYIGQSTRNASIRWYAHLKPNNSGKKTAIGSALRKYGKESFNFEVIDIAESLEQLNHKEEFWIDTFNCIAPNGYNLRSGGQSGYIYSDEVKKRMSELRLAKYADNPGKIRLRRERTPEETIAFRKAGRESCSQKRRGVPSKQKGSKRTPEQNKRNSTVRLGKPHPARYSPIFGNDGSEYISIKSAVIAIGCDRSSLQKVLSGKSKTLYGIKYFYKEKLPLPQIL